MKKLIIGGFIEYDIIIIRLLMNFSSLSLPIVSKITPYLTLRYLGGLVLAMGYLYGAMKGFTKTDCSLIGHPIDRFFWRICAGVGTGLATMISFVTQPWIPLKLLLRSKHVEKKYNKVILFLTC